LKYYFKLQYWRIKRDLTGFGINPYAGLLLYLCSFIVVSILIFKKISLAPYVYPFIALLWIYSFGDEIRNQALQLIFPRKKYHKIRLVENLAGAFPFVCVLVIKNQSIQALLLLVFSGILSSSNSVNHSGIRIPSPFSKYPYEFTIGFRRLWFVILAVYIIGFISVYYQNFNLGMSCLLGIFLICLSFYSHLDPVFYVWIHAQSPENFLKRKIRTALIYSFWLSLMTLIPMCVFFTAWIDKIMIVWAIGLLYMIPGLLAVYVNYPMSMTLSHRFQFYFGIVFPPLFLLVVPNFYFQAINRLKPFLK
jgi:hypothetical protein